MTGEEKRESGVSRREAVKTGTFATAGLLGLSSLGSESARAQSSEPRIRLGDEWVIDPDGDDFSIEHSSLGVSFVWDESAGYWVPGGGGFDMDGGDIVDDGTTVWDSSESQVGDGSTSADHQSVDTELTQLTTPGGTNWSTSAQEVRGGKETFIDDDDTATFTTDEIDGFTAIVQVRSGSDVSVAIIGGRTSGTSTSTIVVQNGTPTIDVTSSDVTGTTGTDGNVTVSIRQGVFEIENRAGGGITCDITIIGA
jgi:hypothetical protein